MARVGESRSQRSTRRQRQGRIIAHLGQVDVKMTKASMIRVPPQRTLQHVTDLEHIGCQRPPCGILVKTPCVEDHETFHEEVSHVRVVGVLPIHLSHSIGVRSTYRPRCECRIDSRMSTKDPDSPEDVGLYLTYWLGRGMRGRLRGGRMCGPCCGAVLATASAIIIISILHYYMHNVAGSAAATDAAATDVVGIRRILHHHAATLRPGH
mmetsp:Transcript_15990/g.34773  ORF Transcript_15990/g.34773 Transcript_15990/m.34773 type:complete len:209 (+) Transcript_15990:1052-1678(+)